MKRGALAVAGLVPMLGLMACSQGAEQGIDMAMADVEAVGAAITTMNADYEAGFNADDAAAVASMFAADAIRLEPNQEAVRGTAGIEEALTRAVAMTSDLKLTNVEYGASGDLAYQIGTYSVTIEPDGAEAYADEGPFIVILKQGEDGSWKIQAQIFNSSLPDEM